MIKKVRNKYFNITFVFRHRWENDKRAIANHLTFKTLKLGIWYRNYKVVSKKNFNQPRFWTTNAIKQHQIGINLIVCKTWIDFSRAGIMEMDINI